MPYTLFPQYQNSLVKWGNIAGTLAEQIDLAQALEGKSSVIHQHKQMLSQFLFAANFNKAGVIAVGQYFTPVFINIPEGMQAKVSCCFLNLSSGEAVGEIRRNDIAINELDNMQFDSSKQKLTPTQDIYLSDGDFIQLEITSISDIPSDLLFQMNILFENII